jgi:hypothetical protein
MAVARALGCDAQQDGSAVGVRKTKLVVRSVKASDGSGLVSGAADEIGPVLEADLAHVGPNGRLGRAAAMDVDVGSAFR